jgi:KaiC/GvpD/RAD55 family RecA-like ATPase
MDRVKTGVKGLDEMLNGGLIARRPYVIVGPMGCGKTTLGVHFLLEGLRNEESVLLVALDDPPNEIKENMHSFGWDVSGIRILDATPDVKAYSKTHAVKELAAKMDVSMFKEVTDIRKSSQQRTMEVSIYSVQQMLKQEMKDYKEVTGNTYTRLVIDSMTALRIFGMKGLDMRTTVQSFFRFLSELEVTALITIDSSARGDTLDTELLLARGEIYLHKWRESDDVVRAVSLEKMRGTDHDLHMRPLKITGNGITVDTKSELVSADDEFTEEFVKMIGEVTAASPAKKKVAKKSRAKKGTGRKRTKEALLAEKSYKTSRTL